MPKTNWKDPKTSEILSTHISGLQEAVRKIEETLDLAVASETDILLEEVFISIDDRYRVYQAPEGKRNWLLSPAPVIKKNGNVITDDFEIDYGGGGIIFTTPAEDGDILTADATIVINESLLLAKIFGTEIEIGQDASTFGADAIAIGKQALANDDNSVSIGNGSVALDADSVAIGAGSKANNQRTIAIGNNAEADNIDGMALGYGAYAFHQRAAAIGKNAKTYSSDEISIGSDEEPKRMRVSGAPVNENDAVRKKELDEHKAESVTHTKADITYYVATTGSDTTGDGTSGLPFKTIQHAIDILPQIINHTVTINVAAGTYAEGVNISGFVGKGQINLFGGTDLSTAVNFKVQSIYVTNCAMKIYIKGFIATTTSHAFKADTCSNITFIYCTSTVVSTSYQGFYIINSLAVVSSCLISNRQYALNAQVASTVLSTNWTAGSGNTLGLGSQGASTIGKSGTQPQGTTAETVTGGGVIR